MGTYRFTRAKGQFDAILAQAVQASQDNPEDGYAAGVAAALSWAIGKSDDNPMGAHPIPETFETPERD